MKPSGLRHFVSLSLIILVVFVLGSFIIEGSSHSPIALVASRSQTAQALPGVPSPKVIFLTSGTTWTVPSDWNSANNTIEVIGGGGGGGSQTTQWFGGTVGGGGGAYSKSSNITLTAGTTVGIHIGAGGLQNTAGGDTYVCSGNSNCTSLNASSVVTSAQGGFSNPGIASSASLGGQASAGIGSVKYSGGSSGTNVCNNGAAGGGGAAGPNGNGGVGGSCSSDGNGGGGGGNGGGTQGGNSSNINYIGGTGGNNSSGTGGGAGGPAEYGNGTAGTNGGGGGGGAWIASGAAGGNGIEWTSVYGSGGGGGGAAGEGHGGNGGLYGGGGGGDGTASGAGGGTGGSGLIVITYTPSTGDGSQTPPVTTPPVTPPTGSGTTFYVTPGGAGAKNGADWNNAFAGLPATQFIRGATYYVASGNYGSYLFNTPESGTSVIAIVKATAANSGTVAGWQSSYGTGQAVFGNAPSTQTWYWTFYGTVFSTGYWTFDGSTSGGANPSGYGFTFLPNPIPANGEDYIDFDAAEQNTFNGITVRNTSITCSSQQVNPEYGINAGTTADVESPSIQYDYVSGCNVAINVFGNNWLIEHTYLLNDWSASTHHGVTVDLQNTYNKPVGNSSIFRYNIVQSCTYSCIESNGTAGTMNGWSIYGNIFDQRSGGTDGIISSSGNSTISNTLIYNNTFISPTMALLWSQDPGGPGAAYTSGDVVENNLIYNAQGNFSLFNSNGGAPIVHGYNSYWSSNWAAQSSDTVSTDQTVASGNPFVSLSGQNYQLAQATATGISLLSPYNIDPSGTARGSSGNWSMGAYQYTGGGTPSPTTYVISASAGSNGSITPTGNTTISSGGSQTYTITPASGYQVSAVTVDGVSVGAVTSYIFSNVISNHSIVVTFSVSVVLGPGNFYVTVAGAGLKNGSSWSNAFAGLPAASMIRGSTYYVASGNYGSYLFNTPESGTSVIAIVKATAANSGTVAGWQSSYGTGQAVFGNSPYTQTSPFALTFSGIDFSTSYWTFDGAVSAGLNPSGYGFTFAQNKSTAGGENYLSISAFETYTFNGMIIKNTAITCSALTGNSEEGIVAGTQSNVVNPLIEYDYISGCNNALFMGGTAWTIEYSYFLNGWSTSSNHGVVIDQFSVNNTTFAYNYVEGCVYICIEANGGVNAATLVGWNIYGNIFNPQFTTPVGIISGASTQVVSSVTIDNNTIINSDGPLLSEQDPGAGPIVGNGNTAVNNLFYNQTGSLGVFVTNGGGAINYGHNSWWNSSDTQTSGTDQAVASGNPFVSLSGQNYRLAQATASGLSLSSPYNIDPDGTVRGLNGNWSIGAYQYTGSGGGTTVTPPTISGITTSGVTQTNTTISWTTSTNASTQIEYGLTSAYGSNTTLISTLTTTHTQTLTNLQPNTLYHYAVISTDSSGNTVTSSDQTFTTKPLLTLTITKSGTGQGTITCAGTSCPTSVTPNTTITLTETPTSGSTFATWSGACTGTSATCTITITTNTTIAATFTTIPVTPPPGITYPLSITTTGSGTITCSLITCPTTVPANTTLTFTATPTSGSTFTSWTGCTSSTSTCTLTITSNTTLSATFTLIPVTPPSGGGSITSVSPPSSGGTTSSGSSPIITSSSGSPTSTLSLPPHILQRVRGTLGVRRGGW